jgi:hypothetical protein
MCLKNKCLKTILRDTTGHDPRIWPDRSKGVHINKAIQSTIRKTKECLRLIPWRMIDASGLKHLFWV